MTPELQRCLWSWSNAGHALVELARAAGLHLPKDFEVPAASEELTADGLTPVLERVGELAGVEVVATILRAGELKEALARASPCLLPVSRGPERAVLALLSRSGRRVRALAPDGTAVWLRLEEVATALSRDTAARLTAETGKALDLIPMGERERARALQAMVESRCRDEVLGPFWLLRPDVQAEPLATGWGVAPLLSALVLATLAEAVIWAGSWWILAHAAVHGHISRGAISGWATLLMSMVPVRYLSAACQAEGVVRASQRLRRKLLGAGLRTPPDAVRRQGAGQLTGLAAESDTLERLLSSGGIAAFSASLELLVVGGLLALTPGALPLLLVLGVFGAAAVGLVVLYARRHQVWMGQRLDVTHSLVEKLIGHRTRLVQLPRERWHDHEDAQLSAYLTASRRADLLAALLEAVLPRAFLLAALSVCAGLLATGGDTGQVVVAVGASLLAWQALSRWVDGATKLAAAGVAFERVRAFVKRSEPDVRPALVVPAGPPSPADGPLLEARGVSFAHAGRSRPVLSGVDLVVKRGDNILLEGPSGSGKSTLTSLLAGLRRADGGLLLLGGLDPSTIGTWAWRRRVVNVAQFHENHVFAQPLAFNLLLGAEWPPSVEAVSQAEAVCRELGLGELLDRMPGGLWQHVGDSGWQLSHGERSRVFLARGLLQSPELLLLDETFGALDPETARQCLDTVRGRASTLLLVAHP